MLTLSNHGRAASHESWCDIVGHYENWSIQPYLTSTVREAHLRLDRASVDTSSFLNQICYKCSNEYDCAAYFSTRQME